MMCKNIFDWNNFFTYLSGPIDFDPDGGKDWRDSWTNKLIDIGFKSNQILNPCKKPIRSAFNDLLDNEAAITKAKRQKKDWDGLAEVMSQIAHIDLRMCDKSDIVLCNFPKRRDCNYQINTYGTMHEIVVARQQRKPVYVVWEGGKEECSGWLMWLVGHKNVFATVEELMLHLKSISQGLTAYNAKEWLLLDIEK